MDKLDELVAEALALDWRPWLYAFALGRWEVLLWDKQEDFKAIHANGATAAEALEQALVDARDLRRMVREMDEPDDEVPPILPD